MAVGYSPRQKGEFCLEIRVERKLGPAWRKAESVQERYSKEVNVLVLESAEVPSAKAVQTEHSFSDHLGSRGKPLYLGASISHPDVNTAGSLGAFVRDSNDEIGVLSCSHVIGRNGQAEVGDYTVHPGRLDVVQLSISHRIGKLAEATMLSKAGTNTLDAAYSLLLNKVAYTGNIIPESVGAPASSVGERIVYATNPELGEDAELAKIGRTTGYSEGVLNAMGVDNLSVLVPGIGLVYFDNCIEVRWKAENKPFTKPGDSGAVVFTIARQQAAGLHFAHGDAERDGKKFKVSYACALEAIMSRRMFNLSWDET